MDNEATSLITALIEAGNIDTVYRDVYLDRARTLLAPLLSLQQFHLLEQQRAELAELPATIARELEKGNWSSVKELSQRAERLKHAMDSMGALLATARSAYDVRNVALDPFSPGLDVFTRIPSSRLFALRTRMLELLGTVERADIAWKDFYAGRRGTFEAQRLGTSEPDSEAAISSPADTVEAARRALRAGDMTRLAVLADALSTKGTHGGSSSSDGARIGFAPAEGEPGQELHAVAYPTETLARARHLGLALRHLEPRIEVASLRRYAWTPLSDAPGDSSATRPPLPSGTPDALYEGLEIFKIHPLVNSGGARYLPSLVAEEILVEDFPDPADGEAAPASELVKSLGLPGRRALPRIAIEHALLTYGARILEKELRLDPRVFRLVCIPPDVYVRVGAAEGWGRQPYWTHLDGYLIRTVAGQMRLQALAGGDVRYGGLYDLLGVARDYDSDRLLARFAVVHRARMVAW